MSETVAASDVLNVAAAPDSNNKPASKRSIIRTSQVQQDSDSDNNEEFDIAPAAAGAGGAAESSTPSKQRSTATTTTTAKHQPSPPVGGKSASPRGKKATATTTASGGGAARKPAGAAGAGGGGAARGRSGGNALQSHKSGNFQNRVAKHNFRDIDNTKPAFKTDRRPRDLSPQNQQQQQQQQQPGGKRSTSGGNALQSHKSGNFQNRAAKHNFRDVDANKPAFKTDRRPVDLKRSELKRQQSHTFGAKVRQHVFRDNSDDEKEHHGSGNSSLRSPRAGGGAAAAAVAASASETNNQQQQDATSNSNNTSNENRPEFYIDPRERPLETSEFDTPEYLKDRRGSKAFTKQVAGHQFRNLESDEVLPPIVTKTDAHSARAQRRREANDKIVAYREQVRKENEKREAAKARTARNRPPPPPPKAATVTPKRSTSTARRTAGGNNSNNNNNNNGGVSSPAGGADGESSANVIPGTEPDATFPRQPRCNPDDLAVPVSRILDLLFNKYAVAAPENTGNTTVFPTAKLDKAVDRLWPGHALTAETYEDCVAAVVDERGASSASPPSSSQNSGAPAGASAASSAIGFAIPDDDQPQRDALPESLLSKREFIVFIKTAQTVNNWRLLLPSETPKVLDLDAFAHVADKLSLESPAKLFMELTNNRGDALALHKLARHIATTARRKSVSSALMAAAAFKAAGRRKEAEEAKQREHEREMEEQEAEDLAHAHFPRQPRCVPEDLTLPTQRIMMILFEKASHMSAAASFSESQFLSSSMGGESSSGFGGGGAVVVAASAATAAVAAAAAGEGAAASAGGGGGGDENATAPDVFAHLAPPGGEKLFQLSKLHGCLNRIWPGNNIPHDMSEDAIEAVEGERTAEEAQQRGQDRVSAAEYVKILRVITNLNNWKTVIPPGTPKKLDLDAFAGVAEKLRMKKPGKLFMTLTKMRGDFVMQGALALHYANKRKTLRFSATDQRPQEEEEESDHDDEDEEENDEAGGGAGAGGGGGAGSSGGLGEGKPSFHTEVKRVAAKHAASAGAGGGADASASANNDIGAEIIEEEEIDIVARIREEQDANNANENSNNQQQQQEEEEQEIKTRDLPSSGVAGGGAAAALFGGDDDVGGGDEAAPATAETPPSPFEDACRQVRSELSSSQESFIVKSSLGSLVFSIKNNSSNGSNDNEEIDSSVASEIQNLIACGALRLAAADKIREIIVSAINQAASATSTKKHLLCDFVAELCRFTEDMLYEAQMEETDQVRVNKKRAKRDGQPLVSAEVIMFSGCCDDQTSADVADAGKSFGHFKRALGPSKGGGAMTNAMQAVLHQHENDISFGELLGDMLDILKEKNYTQTPQLSASHDIEINTKKFSVLSQQYKDYHAQAAGGGAAAAAAAAVDEDDRPKCRALTIGVNYIGQGDDVELDGCANDAVAWRGYVQSRGYPADCVRLLTDAPGIENVHGQPTKKNILENISWLVSGAKAGDSLFLHFSGHGTQRPSEGGDGDDVEADGLDELLAPSDWQSPFGGGEIADDVLFQRLLAPLPPGVQLLVVFDACHSGSALDLERVFQASVFNMEALRSGRLLSTVANPKFIAEKFEQAAAAVGEGIYAGIEAIGDGLGAIWDALF